MPFFRFLIHGRGISSNGAVTFRDGLVGGFVLCATSCLPSAGPDTEWQSMGLATIYGRPAALGENSRYRSALEKFASDNNLNLNVLHYQPRDGSALINLVDKECKGFLLLLNSVTHSDKIVASIEANSWQHCKDETEIANVWKRFLEMARKIFSSDAVAEGVADHF